MSGTRGTRKRDWEELEEEDSEGFFWSHVTTLHENDTKSDTELRMRDDGNRVRVNSIPVELAGSALDDIKIRLLAVENLVEFSKTQDCEISNQRLEIKRLKYLVSNLKQQNELNKSLVSPLNWNLYQVHL